MDGIVAAGSSSNKAAVTEWVYVITISCGSSPDTEIA